MLTETVGNVPFVCRLKTMYNPIPTQPAMSPENTHRTGLLRAVNAYSLCLVQPQFKCTDGIRELIAMRTSW